MGWAKHAMAEPVAGEGGILAALREHLPSMGKVAMALVGDGARVETILEEVAREAATTPAPPPTTKAWLLGLVRAASARQLSKLPLRTRGGGDAAPSTQRLGAAATTRSALQELRPTEREAVVLAIIGRLDPPELALACNVDEATAKSRLARGLEQMLAAEGKTQGERSEEEGAKK